MSATDILKQIEDLPPAEQQVVAELVWEKYGTSEDELTPEQSAELDRRVEELRQHPERGIPWETVQAELEERLKSRKA